MPRSDGLVVKEETLPYSSVHSKYTERSIEFYCLEILPYKITPTFHVPAQTCALFYSGTSRGGVNIDSFVREKNGFVLFSGIKVSILRGRMSVANISKNRTTRKTIVMNSYTMGYTLSA